MAREDTGLKVWSVSELTAEVRDALYDRPSLQAVWVAGEVSNLRRPASGHAYFTLKDDEAALKCVLFRSHGRLLGFELKDGMNLLAYGNVDVYEKNGEYQLYVKTAEPTGVGSLHLALEARRKKLEKEGLFDPARKRPLPKFPERIGVVTSKHGAALRDIIQVIRRRNPLCHIRVAHAAVQGDRAPAELIEALEMVGQPEWVDLVIIGRGGGSLEDLWAFNDENLVRAVAECPVPVVAAVGHETDVSLCDFAADVRAPTPSAAAELVVPERERLIREVHQMSEGLARRLQTRLEMSRERLHALLKRRSLQRPERMVEERWQDLDALQSQLVRGMRLWLKGQRQQVDSIRSQLLAYSPWAVLERGYSLVTDPGGGVITSAGALSEGDHITVQFSEGRINAEVLETDGEGAMTQDDTGKC